MISKSQFISKIQTKVFPQLLATESCRKKALGLGLFFLFMAGLLLIYTYKNYERVLGDDDFVLAGIIICIGITSYIWTNFVRKQKRKFSPIFLELLGNLYNRQEAINKTLLQHTCLFPRFDYIAYDDCISGTFEHTQFSLAEIKLCICGGKHDTTIFRGVCIDIPMKIPVSGYTLLYNTKIPQKIPVLQPVSLEDASFCHNYQIYSDNQIDARVLLTPAFIEKLNKLKSSFHNKRIDVAFFDNHAFFVVRTGENLFESYSLFRNVTNIKIYAKFYDEIKAIYDMTHILAINNKSVPTGGVFNQELYRQIVSKQKKQANCFFWAMVFMVPVTIFVIVTLLCDWGLGLVLAFIALVLCGVGALASRR